MLLNREMPLVKLQYQFMLGEINGGFTTCEEMVGWDWAIVPANTGVGMKMKLTKQ